jgi:hypothetical protein
MKRKLLYKIMAGSMGVTAAFATSANAQTLVDPNFAGPGTPNPITLTSGPGGTSGVNQGWATFNNSGTATLGDNMGSSIYSPYNGAATALLETAGPGGSWAPAGAYQIISGITPGDKYTFNVWYLTDTVNDAYAATAGVLIQLGFETPTLGGATSVENPNNTVGIDNPLPAIGVWTEGTVSATAPAGCSDAIVYCMFQQNGGAPATSLENLYWDDATIVPEPAGLALLGMGLAAVPFYFRRQRKS